MKEILERMERLEKIILIGSKEVLNTADVALLLDVTPGRVRQMCSNHELPYYRQDGRKQNYFRKSDIWKVMMSGARIASNEEIRSEADRIMND